MKLRTHYAHTIATTSPQPPRNLGTISPPSRPRPASEIRARLEGGCGRAAATASTPGAGAPWRQLLSAATAATVQVHCTHVFILSMPCGDECLMCVGDRRRSYRGVERHVSLRAYRVIFPLARGGADRDRPRLPVHGEQHHSARIAPPGVVCASSARPKLPAARWRDGDAL